MIQRLQTIYLLVTISLLSVMSFVPFAKVATNDGELILKPFLISESGSAQASLSAVVGLTYLSAIAFLAMLVAIFTIFKFKNRILQIKLCFINMVLFFGLQAFTLYSMYKASSFIEGMNSQISGYSAGINFSLVAILPFVAVVFTYLAYRGIIKDENLIKSLNRIR
ncbi:MAG: DUF4293 domain-containing protein [Rikenellaceae bacterium]